MAENSFSSVSSRQPHRLFLLLIRPGNRAIFSRSLKSIKMKAILFLIKLLRGRSYEAPRQKVPIRFKGVPKKTADIPYLYQEGDNLRVLHESGRNKGICIGYPFLYLDWVTFINRVASSVAKQNLPGSSSAKQIFSVFLGSSVSGIYDASEQKQFIADVLNAIRDVVSAEVLIFVKPHPTSNIEEITNMIPDSLRDYVAVTSTNASVLASLSRLVICRHSSTILDVLALDKPAILFQKFSDQWKKVHPDKSCYLQLGVQSAESYSQLKMALTRCLSEGDIDILIRGALNHEEPRSIEL